MKNLALAFLSSNQCHIHSIGPIHAKGKETDNPCCWTGASWISQIPTSLWQKASEGFPESWSWDHKIKLKEGLIPKAFKKYNLTPVEQRELNCFINNNLEKGYIPPSQSPMASPFFSSAKRLEALDPVRIIDISTMERSRMPIHFPLSRNSLIYCTVTGLKLIWPCNIAKP